MIRIKICGITSYDDAWAAVEAGADALGFIFVERTPRYIQPNVAAAIVAKLPPFVTTVGVFIDRAPAEIERIISASGLSLAQLHGEESPEMCGDLRVPFIKAIRVRGESDLEAVERYPQAKAFLLDAYIAGRPGGTGRAVPGGL